VNDIDRLRRLAFNLAATDTHALGVDWGESSLDPRTLALVRLGAVAAMGGCAVTSYGALTDDALANGASIGDVVDVLFGVLPIVGTARVVAAAPGVALALGHDLDGVPGAWPPEQ
jgi:alkylhydroperoxidase/carboxymuconolactone decarboxylase family protein YurZ